MVLLKFGGPGLRTERLAPARYVALRLASKLQFEIPLRSAAARLSRPAGLSI
jgi:hypothetical protein